MTYAVPASFYATPPRKPLPPVLHPKPFLDDSRA